MLKYYIRYCIRSQFFLICGVSVSNDRKFERDREIINIMKTERYQKYEIFCMKELVAKQFCIFY